MSSICSPNFQFTFSKFDKVTYVIGSYRLTPQRTECKHLLKDLAFNFLHDRICLQNSLGGGGGEQTHSQSSVYCSLEDSSACLSSDFFSKLTFSKIYFMDSISVEKFKIQTLNSAWPDLGSNCFQRLSADNAWR